MAASLRHPVWGEVEALRGASASTPHLSEQPGGAEGCFCCRQLTPCSCLSPEAPGPLPPASGSPRPPATFLHVPMGEPRCGVPLFLQQDSRPNLLLHRAN